MQSLFFSPASWGMRLTLSEKKSAWFECIPASPHPATTRTTRPLHSRPQEQLSGSAPGAKRNHARQPRQTRAGGGGHPPQPECGGGRAMAGGGGRGGRYRGGRQQLQEGRGAWVFLVADVRAGDSTA